MNAGENILAPFLVDWAIQTQSTLIRALNRVGCLHETSWGRPWRFEIFAGSRAQVGRIGYGRILRRPGGCPETFGWFIGDHLLAFRPVGT